MWDDMLRHWSPKDLADSGLGELVEPVVWVYSEDIMRLLPQYIWYMYGRAFPHIWVASAFKGAFGETAVAPNLQRHAENNLAWLRIVQTTKGVPFRGMVLTGWARYDHFAVLCELLPVSVPSLLLNLLLVLHPHWPKSQVIRLWMQALSCPPGLTADKSLDSDPFQWHLGTCAFPGSNLFSAVGSYVSLQARVSTLYTDVTERHGWLTVYNVHHNFSSPWRLLEVHAIVQQLLRELTTFRNSTAHIMTQYFDQFVVDEWLEQKVDPLAEKMTSLKHFVQSLVARDTWPRRPLLS
jgi:hexosaminidase